MLTYVSMTKNKFGMTFFVGMTVFCHPEFISGAFQEIPTFVGMTRMQAFKQKKPRRSERG